MKHIPIVDVLSKLARSWPVAAIAVDLFCATFSPADSSPGRIIGHIDGMRFEIDGYYVWGWACQQGQSVSIAVHLFADDSLMFGGKADLDSEPGVNRNCQDARGGKHRFRVAIPTQYLAATKGKKLYVRGIRIVGAVENTALDESGTLTLPDPPVLRTVPRTYPALSGKYQSSAQHPRVFMTPIEVEDVVKRINTPGTFPLKATLGWPVRSRKTSRARPIGMPPTLGAMGRSISKALPTKRNLPMVTIAARSA